MPAGYMGRRWSIETQCCESKLNHPNESPVAKITATNTSKTMAWRVAFILFTNIKRYEVMNHPPVILDDFLISLLMLGEIDIGDLWLFTQFLQCFRKVLSYSSIWYHFSFAIRFIGIYHIFHRFLLRLNQCHDGLTGPGWTAAGHPWHGQLCLASGRSSAWISRCLPSGYLT